MSSIRKLNRFNKTARTFLPDILAPGTGLSPITDRAIIQTPNVVTIQDILEGYKYKLPGAGGSWSEGEEYEPYTTRGDLYKRLERDFDIVKKMLGNGTSAPSEEWTVKVPGGEKTFPSLPLAQEYGKKLSEKGIPVKSIRRTRTAQVAKPVDVVSTSMAKTYTVLVTNQVKATQSNGTAFCIAPNYFMTCTHVIQRYNKANGEKLNIPKISKECTITLIQNDKQYPASIEFVNEAMDVAILKSGAPAMVFEFEKNLKIGDDIIVIGSPHGFEGNVTFGNINSLNRVIYRHKGAPRYIFIDASVFSGNSGGPVVNASSGKVVGMVTAIAAASGEYGLNAAIPSFYLGKIKAAQNIKSASVKQVVKVAQSGFSGYYSGEVPDYAAGLIGSSNVDARQVKSVFGKADEAIRLVNEFDSSLLLNISFIFNFSNSGAYGVYLSELDNAIKTKALQKRLEEKGYVVKEENGMPVAIPTKEEKTQQEIEAEIKQIYDGLNKGGGTAIGVNVSKVLASSKDNANKIQTSEPEFVYEQLAILHLGETIVHEAIHAKGSHSEGPSEQGEAKFVAWALPKINENYKKHLQGMNKEQEFAPLILTASRKASTNFYREAQAMFGPFGGATGSDLSGRMGGNKYQTQQGRADWSKVFTYNPHASVESRLGRDYMWPLAQDIDVDKDSIEEQLRKTDKDIYKKNPNMAFDELLQKDYVEDGNQYKSIEERLMEKRPSPLIQTLKAASKMTKQATLFGYFNNLSVSDGSTIPGLSDRVMAWEDRDELFAQEEQWIREQPRYNPEYDIMGFYYRWIEPQFAPTLFDDPNVDKSNTHPAKRFASHKVEVKVESHIPEDILEIISKTKEMIESGKCKAVRFIASDDLTELVSDAFGGLNVKLIDVAEKKNDETVFVMWVYADAEEAEIDIAESYFRGSGDENAKEVADRLTGIVSYRDNNVVSVLGKLREIKQRYNLADIYLVGEMAREFVYSTSVSNGHMSLVSNYKTHTVKYAHILATELGCNFRSLKNGDIVIPYNDILIKFHCGNTNKQSEFLKEIMGDEDYCKNKTLLNLEILNRDFTINMLAYNVINEKVYSPYDIEKEIASKVLRTRFNPDVIIKENPIILARALLYVVQGYEMDHKLETAVLDNAQGISELPEEYKRIIEHNLHTINKEK